MTTPDPLDAPYEIHTGRELELMLGGGKPLAHFCDAYPPEPSEDIVPRRAFAPHIGNGIFEAREFVELLKAPLTGAPAVRGCLHVFYARPGESWRIDAYIAVLMAARKAGWNEGFERLQGSLLGYTDSQNDAHIERMLRSPQMNDFPWLRALRTARGTIVATPPGR